MITQKYNIHRISKRYISDLTEFKNLLEDINNSNRKILKKNNVEPNPILDNKYKECTKIEEITYKTDIETEKLEGIIENIKETNFIIDRIKFINDNIKLKNNNIEVEVIEKNILNEDNNIDILNTIDNNIIIENIKKDDVISAKEALKNSMNTSFFTDITNFIYNLPDMLNTPGRIVLFTIGAGIVIGGTYYFGSTIKEFIFKKNTYTNAQPIQIQTPINITIPQIQTESINENQTFFKQVGERIIKLLDILINKYQFKKYK
jgi:hypothetical protein